LNKQEIYWVLALVVAQNQSPRKDVGLTTSILLLLRAMGGACGATITGAMVSGIDEGASIQGFRVGFFICTLFCATGLVIAIHMREAILRNTLEEGPAAANDPSNEELR
jgi:hypothetical protein